ncbi:MAG: hypothetical protein MJ124_07160 [Lachnospiraceae bacterium]|nr:hypothetical protein [Lachnospiraceae bacterium]
MADYITTYSGIHFYPTEPDVNLVKIEDVAHALSLICRGNGHVKSFYSVGQHCIYCAREALERGYSKRVALAGLLHDAGECYMSDVPRPFKKSLPAYVQQEERLIELVYEHFLGSPATEEEKALVKEIDDDLLWYDLKYLLNEEMSTERPSMKIEISYDFRPFDEVEKEYLELFNLLTNL